MLVELYTSCTRHALQMPPACPSGVPVHQILHGEMQAAGLEVCQHMNFHPCRSLQLCPAALYQASKPGQVVYPGEIANQAGSCQQCEGDSVYELMPALPA
jgi:hypothetical protein